MSASARGFVTKTFRCELVTACTQPVAIAMVEGGFAGILADKIFHAPPYLLALVAAAPMFGNLTSGLWAKCVHGRPKISFIVGLQIALLLCVASISFLPVEGAAGAVGLAIAVIASRSVIAGIITVRSVVWRQNYPRSVRARLTSRLAVVAIPIIVVTSLLGGEILDRSPESFRWIYPLAAVIGAIGAAAFSRLRMRGEAGQLAEERLATDRADNGGPRHRMWTVLRNDPHFGRYLTWQFFGGWSNMMIEIPVIYLISHELNASYGVSVLLASAIPMGVGVLTLPFWARLLDRVHIVRFRTWQSWLWTLSQVLTWVAVIQGSIVLLGVARTALGLARGGGILAWQLGHYDFSGRAMAAVYMGIHLTLTGVRGAIAPFFGMMLYVGWGSMSLPGLPGVSIPVFSGIGHYVFLVAAALGLISWLGFVHLARTMRVGGGARQKAD